MVAPWVCVTVGDSVALAQDADIPAHPSRLRAPLHLGLPPPGLCLYQGFI